MITDKGTLVEFRDKTPNPSTGLSHDGKYKVLGLCSVKDPTTREWFEAVMYQETELGGEVYVREKTDFIDKFIES